MKQSVQAKENPEEDKSVTGYNQGKQKREKKSCILRFTFWILED